MSWRSKDAIEENKECTVEAKKRFLRDSSRTMMKMTLWTKEVKGLSPHLGAGIMGVPSLERLAWVLG